MPPLNVEGWGAKRKDATSSRVREKTVLCVCSFDQDLKKEKVPKTKRHTHTLLAHNAPGHLIVIILEDLERL
jgi:hypothetical protein